MRAELHINGQHYGVNLNDHIDISLLIKQGDENPNCYFADPVRIETIVQDNFIGSVEKGGTVNYQKLSITPHGNGTHTECYGHLTAKPQYLNETLKNFHFLAQVVTLPVKDNKVHLEDLDKASLIKDVQAIIIRTLPNDEEKKTKHYSGTNPPFLDPKLCEYLAEKKIQHLVVDLPSVDPEVDGGKLLAHRAFWGENEQRQAECTITELAFIPNSVPNGVYLLNLQVINLKMDASPSRPLLYKIIAD